MGEGRPRATQSMDPYGIESFRQGGEFPPFLMGSINSIPSGLKRMSPIEEFYQNNPGARNMGEGRMTGQFEEGSGGLRDLLAGLIKPRSLVQPTSIGPKPDLLDEYIQSVSGPKKQFEMGGTTYRPNEIGSHVAVK